MNASEASDEDGGKDPVGSAGRDGGRDAVRDASIDEEAPTSDSATPTPGSCTPSQEVCDGKDNDCDGDVDEQVRTRCWADADGDGYASARAKETTSCDACGAKQTAQEPITGKADCDDTSADKSPGATDVCGDEVDNDCDGTVDDEANNACGGPCSVQLGGKPGDACTNGLEGACARAGKYECRPDHTLACSAPSVQPGAREICGDSSDNDCKGGVDDGCMKNECGGWSTLANPKGASCTADSSGCASAGTYVCSGTDATVCNAAPKAKNACGGCASLANTVGAACTVTQGVCQYPGTYQCQGTDATSCVKSPTKSNLVEDPGFEAQGASVAAPWANFKGAYIESSPTGAHQGSKSAAVVGEPENATSVANWNDIYQVIKVEPNTRYKLQAWVKTSANTAYGRLGVRGAGNDWATELAENSGRTFGAASTYQLMSTLFSTTTQTRVTVYVGLNSGAAGERTTLWVDDFRVIKDDICAE